MDKTTFVKFDPISSSHIRVVIFLATGSCSMTKLWGSDVPTSVRDCYYPMSCRFCCVLFIPVPPFNCFLDTPPSPSVSRLPLPSATLRLSCTALCTRFSTLIPFLDCLAKQVSISSGLHCPSCTLCLVVLNLLPRSLSALAAPQRSLLLGFQSHLQYGAVHYSM